MLFLLLACAVLFGALRAGMGIGLLLTLIGTLLVGSPTPPKLGGDEGQLHRIASFVLVGVSFSLFSESLRNQRRAIEDAENRARAERDRLAEAEARFQAVADMVPVCLWMTGPDGRVRWANRRWEALTGQSTAIATPDRLFTSVHPHDLPTLLAACETPAGAGTQRLEFRLKLAQGGEAWFAAELTPQFGPSGDYLGRMGTAVDIDGHRKGNEEQSRRRLFFEILISQAPIGIAVLETKAERFVLANPMFRSLAPHRKDDFVGSTLAEVFPEVLEQGGQAILEKVVHENRPVQVREFEIKIRAGDESSFWNADVVPIAGPDGSVEQILILIVPTTESVVTRRRLESLKEAAEQSNRAMDRFLAVLSHELRTPLMPVLAAATELAEDPELPRSAHSTIEMVRRNIELESRLIDDLLDMTRISKGKLVLQVEPTDVHTLLELALGICRPEIEANRVSLRLDWDAVRPIVMGDPARLQQVFWNLIKNAVKFMPEGGTLTIRTRTGRHPDPSQARSVLQIEVADTGVGIEEEAIRRIFEPFEQASVSTSRRFGGLGLGLSISRSIIEAHGGVILAESPGPGCGTTFRLELEAVGETAPAEERRLALATPHQTPARARRSLHVLLVEDDPDTLGVMARILSKRGHQVVTARSIAEARTRLGQAGPPAELLICDLGLPDGSGLELISEWSQNGRMPAIALSGYGREEDLSRSQEAGFFEHLTKPVGLVDLMSAIDRVVELSDRLRAL